VTPVPLMLALLAAAAVFLWPPARGVGAAALLASRSRQVAAGRGREPRLRDRVRWGAPSDPAAAAEDLATLLEVLVPPLQAGVATAEAVRIGAGALRGRASVGALAGDLVTATARGLPVGPVWQASRSSPTGRRTTDVSAQRFVAQAWLLSEQTGVPLAVALAAAARALRTQQAAARALAAATAGARASMTLLALMPASGPVIGLLFGFTPADLYAASPAATAALLVGVLLGAAGWAWSRAILRRAVQHETVS
jgi:tight adherence protein B